jgi:hypothetical protein
MISVIREDLWKLQSRNECKEALILEKALKTPRISFLAVGLFFVTVESRAME